jgi:hypothetical protein
MDMKAHYATILLAIISILCGCSALTPIRTYTTASKNGVDAFVSLSYNFEQNCLASCRDHDLEMFRLTSVDCDCKDSKLADSINSMMANAVRAYVHALGQLSGKDVGALPIPALSESLQANLAGNVKLSQKEIDAYTTIGNLLSNALSGQYRKSNLKSFVSKAQTPFTILINHLQLNQSKNLNGLIDIRMQRNKSVFYEHIRDKRYSPYQKREITAAYYKIYDHLEEQKLANLYFARVLEEIKMGHTNLYNNLEAWNSDQLVKMIANNAATIESLLRKIEKLK